MGNSAKWAGQTRVRLIGFDLGKRRVGIAYGNDRIGVVVPLEPYLVRTNLIDELDLMLAMVAEHEPELLILGDPLTLEGHEGLASKWVHEIGDVIACMFAGEVAYIDERLSTRSATAALHQAGTASKKMRSRVDSAAAVVILEHYIDSRKQY